MSDEPRSYHDPHLRNGRPCPGNIAHQQALAVRLRWFERWALWGVMAMVLAVILAVVLIKRAYAALSISPLIGVKEFFRLCKSQ